MEDFALQKRKKQNGYCTMRSQKDVNRFLACVASVSVWFRSKEIPRKGTFGFDRARNETRVCEEYLQGKIFVDILKLPKNS